MPSVYCDNCGKIFEVKPAVKLRQKSFACCNECRIALLIKRSKARHKTVVLKCANCLKDFEVKACYKTRYRFCSMQCRAAYYKNHPTEHPQWTGGMLEKICPACQKHFRIKRSHFDKRIYCSKACYGKAQAERQKGDNNPSKRETARNKIKQSWLLRPRQQKVFLICPVCNKMFPIHPSEVKKGRRFCSKSCSNASWSVRVLHPLPNRPEQALQKLLDKYFPNTWKYTGDGSFLVGWYNPDFANCDGRKDIIELFGDYWHSMKVIKKKWARTELGRVMAYNSLGYRCLIIWEHELADEQAVVAKIQQFMKKTKSHHDKVKKESHA